MNRDITNKINYVLDNWVPPRIRDSRILMSIAVCMAFGPKYKYFMSFKEKVNDMKEDEINYYYEFLADAMGRLNRKTDLNSGCVRFILNHVQGSNVLDAAAGRGYLAELLVRRVGKRGLVEAADIVLPEKVQKGGALWGGVHYQEATLTSLPYENKAFDTVICTHALEHIKDSRQALRELRRVCRKRLIIVVPRQREYRYTFDLHINFFPYEYSIRSFINNPEARIMEIGGDWVCVEDFSAERSGGL